MHKQDVRTLRELATRIGEFIRYWGFRKIHGQIWAMVYLSKNRLSGAELAKLLGASKALVSPALKELVGHGLILETDSENAKTKRYEAVEDVNQAIHRVLQSREQPMLASIAAAYANVEASEGVREFAELGRIAAVGQMIEMAESGVAFLVGSNLANHD